MTCTGQMWNLYIEELYIEKWHRDLLTRRKQDFRVQFCFFSDLYSLSRCICVYCLLVLICFETQYSKIICYMKKLLSWPHKRNHFTQSTFYILLEYEMAIFFPPELAIAGFSILITVKGIWMVHLCYLDSIHVHELGSHSRLKMEIDVFSLWWLSLVNVTLTISAVDVTVSLASYTFRDFVFPPWVVCLNMIYVKTGKQKIANLYIFYFWDYS